MCVIVALARQQSPHNNTIDRPSQQLWFPIDGVCMKSALWTVYREVTAAIVRARDTFAEIIVLAHVRPDIVLSAAEFPINFVEIVRDEDCTADDSCAWRGLQDDFDFAEKDEEVCPELRSIVSLGEGKFSALVTIIHCCIIGDGPVRRLARLRSKVDTVDTCCQTWVGVANVRSILERIARKKLSVTSLGDCKYRQQCHGNGKGQHVAAFDRTKRKYRADVHA